MLLRGVLLFTLLCVIREALAQSMQGVAPGDEEQLCTDLRMSGIAPTPDYDPNMAILMDSNNYQNLLPNRTGAVWQQVDNDGNNDATITTNWIQQSNSPCNQAVQVCGFTAGAQDNRLITQLINRTVNGLRLPRVSVLIEFELRSCDIALNCQRTFNTHVYETSSVDNAAARNVNNYRQVRRVSPSVTDGSGVNETVDIDFITDQSSFYFSIEDESTCIVVIRMIVFYTVCPKQAVDMISYPQTTAPTTGITTISTVCVENAEPVGAQPKVACSSDGGWDALVSQCRCLPGAFSVSGACILCLAGTYSSPSNGNCSLCPANSFSDRDGLAECTCDPGYYRTPGEEDLPCRMPPPPPTSVQVKDTTEHTITVTWNPPANYISANITYDVYIVRIERNQQEQTRLRVYRGPNTEYTIQNLDPGARYNVSVSTFSDLTDQILAAGDIDVIAVSQPITVPGGPADNTVIVAVVVALVVIAFIIVITVLMVILFLIWKHSSHRNEHLDASANVIYEEVKIYSDDRDRQHVVASGPSQENNDVTICQVGRDLSSDIATSSNVVYGAKLDSIATSSNTAYGAKVDSITTSINTAYGTKLDNIATSSNVAYSGMQLVPPQPPVTVGEVYEDPDGGYEMLDIEPMYDTCS